MTAWQAEYDLGRRDSGRFQLWHRYLEGNWLEDARPVSHMLQVVKPPDDAPVPPKLCWREIRLQDMSNNMLGWDDLQHMLYSPV